MADNIGATGQLQGADGNEHTLSQGGFGITTHWTQNIISGMYFGGVSVHNSGNVGKTYIIDADSVWTTQEDVQSPGFADSYIGGHEQAYKDIATQMSGAAGKIYIEICRCVGLQAYNTSRAAHQRGCFAQILNHPEVCMSGFWIQGSRFVTSAHFLDVIPLSDEEKQNTEKYLKWKASSSESRSKVIVSSDNRVAQAGSYASKAVYVYLLKLNKESDLAIFQAYDGNRRGNPIPHGLLRSQLATMAHCDQSQGAYTIGYYAHDVVLSTLTPFDAQTLNTFWTADDGTRPKTYFPVKYAGVMQERNDSVQFGDVFEHPNYRTISTGNLEKAISTHMLSTFVFCQISAWYQSSGGMVGGFVRRQVNGREELSPVVLGVFRGEQGPTNVIAAFTAEGIKWLFNRRKITMGFMLALTKFCLKLAAPQYCSIDQFDVRNCTRRPG